VFKEIKKFCYKNIKNYFWEIFAVYFTNTCKHLVRKTFFTFNCENSRAQLKAKVVKFFPFLKWNKTSQVSSNDESEREKFSSQVRRMCVSLFIKIDINHSHRTDISGNFLTVKIWEKEKNCKIVRMSTRWRRMFTIFFF
jgi:hypothetical protein